MERRENIRRGRGDNMTNEKAIMCLEDMKIKVPIPKAAKQARENNEALDVAIKALQTEPHWIPCSERLPDMHDEVLVTARGEVSIAWLYVDGKWRSNDMPQPMFKDIIAWMPLPEPMRLENK